MNPVIRIVFPSVNREEAPRLGRLVHEAMSGQVESENSAPSSGPVRAVTESDRDVWGSIHDSAMLYFEGPDELLRIVCPECRADGTSEFAQDVVKRFIAGQVPPIACPACNAEVDWQKWDFGPEVQLAYLGIDDWSEAEIPSSVIRALEAAVGHPARVMTSWM